jgi:hypothetical protein
MLIDVKLKLKSAWLGNQYTLEKVRRFKKTADQTELIIDQPHWQWAVTEASHVLGFTDKIDASCLRPPLTIRTPTLRLFHREWRNADRKQGEDFEMIQDGTVLSFDMMLMETPESKSKLRAPNLQEARKIMDTAGMWCGFSPFGNKFGYGRCVVLSMEAKILK